MRVVLFAMIVAVGWGALLGQTGSETNACDLLPKVTVPEKDWPTLAEAYSADVPIKRDGDLHASACDPVGFYYGKSAGHFEKARYCVLAQIGMIRGTNDQTKIKAAQDAATGGATDPGPEELDGLSGLVLAMVYGNGEGVARNLPLARQFVCQYGGGIQSEEPANLLQDFEKTIGEGGHYDVCKDGGGRFGRSTTYGCLGLQIGTRDAEIQRLERAVLAGANPAVKASFVSLRSAWRAYHTAYGTMDSAICDGGTGCGVFGEVDDLTITATWLAVLKDVQAGKAPAAGIDPSTFARVDRDLNAKYQQELKDTQDLVSGSCCSAQVRAADRAWLRYREAWVQFGAVRWPEIPADQWRAWQTVEWTALLSGDN